LTVCHPSASTVCHPSASTVCCPSTSAIFHSATARLYCLRCPQLSRPLTRATGSGKQSDCPPQQCLDSVLDYG
jgi:hypothetical protein